MGTLEIIKPSGEHWETACPDTYAGEKDFRDRLRKIVGGDTEHVRVKYNGKYIHMIVNETGAIQDPPLPENPEATRIYHQNMADKL